MTTALVVVDVQNDFCEGGSLAVTGGARVAARMTTLLDDPVYDAVVATKDHHVDPGAHFSDTPDYVDSWPRHCVAGTPGADFHPDLRTERIEAVFSKGEYDAAYSGFEGVDPSGATLTDWLRERGVDTVHIAGLTTDHCVLATALDSASAGFDTTVHADHCAAVTPADTDAVFERLHAAGVRITGRGRQGA